MVKYVDGPSTSVVVGIEAIRRTSLAEEATRIQEEATARGEQGEAEPDEADLASAGADHD